MPLAIITGFRQLMPLSTALADTFMLLFRFFDAATPRFQRRHFRFLSRFHAAFATTPDISFSPLRQLSALAPRADDYFHFAISDDAIR
jgi:hypothetical protein